jgi:hypothetical protein
MATRCRRRPQPTTPFSSRLVCRQALGKGPSDSVDWKSFAHEHYGLQITTPGGVRNLVRALDLEGVELPSIRRVVGEIVAWAKTTAGRD